MAGGMYITNSFKWSALTSEKSSCQWT